MLLALGFTVVAAIASAWGGRKLVKRVKEGKSINPFKRRK